MKTLFALLAVLLIAFSINSFAQQTKEYTGTWDQAAVGDSVIAWDVYIEAHQGNTGWMMQDAMEYDLMLEQFYVGTVQNTNQIKPEFKFSFPLDGQFRKLGVVANNGVRSQVGVSGAVRVPKKPGKPTGVTLTPNP